MSQYFVMFISPLLRQIFDVFENESHLCRRFTVFVTKYNLMSKVCSKYWFENGDVGSFPKLHQNLDFQDNLIVPMLEQEASAGGESEA